MSALCIKKRIGRSVDLLRSRGPATEPLILSAIQFNKIGTWDYCQELIICNLYILKSVSRGSI